MYISEKIKKEFIKFGQHLEELRKERNISIKELSARTGIRKEYLKKIENGNAYGVKLETHIVKIAKAMNITLYKLFDFE
ncbi:helix-turn-helix transcriptional regulator [bacterium]|nr:helix-turn-helix transcriptional regulator [bacterium]